VTHSTGTKVQRSVDICTPILNTNTRDALDTSTDFAGYPAGRISLNLKAGYPVQAGYLAVFST
jgi:hypothetical protein